MKFDTGIEQTFRKNSDYFHSKKVLEKVKLGQTRDRSCGKKILLNNETIIIFIRDIRKTFISNIKTSSETIMAYAFCIQL